MNNQGNHRNVLRQLTVRSQLLLGFGLVTLLAAGLGVSSYYGLSRQNEALESFAEGSAVAQSAESLNIAVLQARRWEKDFLQRKDDVYVRQNREMREAAKKHLTDLEGSSIGTELSDRISAARSVIEGYSQGFEQAVTILQTIGDKDTGAYGSFRSSAHDIEAVFNESPDDRLFVHLLMMRRHEKDYFLRADPKYVDSFRDRARLFGADIERSGLARDRQASLEEALSTYVAKFEETVELFMRRDQSIATFREEIHKIDPIVDVIRERAFEAELQASEEAREIRSTISTLIVSLVVLVVLISTAFGYYLSSQLSRGIHHLVDAASAISNGDLRDHLSGNGHGHGNGHRDELGQLSTTFDTMRDSLRQMVSSLQSGVSKLSSSSAEIASTAKQSAATSTEQASTVAQISATTEEIHQTSKAASSMAQDVVQAAEHATESGQRGLEAASRSVELMGVIGERVSSIAQQILELSEQTGRIRDIVDTVNDLAEQSNVLAVNASIEAAKAGEEGRGFAVVASEVRDLASQSKQATQQIRGLLAEIQKATHSAVMATEEGNKCTEDGRDAIASVCQVIEELSTALEENNERARQISAASHQQASGISQISAALEGITQAGRESASGVRQLEDSVVDMSDLARDLSGLISEYRLN